MVRISAIILSLVLTAMVSTGANAQGQTLADIRQELSVLFVEMQRTKRELSTTGGVSTAIGGTSLLERVDQIEAELARLTQKTEQLENRINRVVQDGTNRIGDLEFRLVELEGGDVSQLGETTTLGGAIEADVTSVVIPETSGGTELAVGEQFDFDQAKLALDENRLDEAVAKFVAFTENYTGGPMTGEAHFYRGQALFLLGDTGNAARAFLESFSGSPNSPSAPDALYHLGLALGKLGQMNEACISLSEVSVRFPASDAVANAQTAFNELGCP